MESYPPMPPEHDPRSLIELKDLDAHWSQRRKGMAGPVCVGSFGISGMASSIFPGTMLVMIFVISNVSSLMYRLVSDGILL